MVAILNKFLCNNLFIYSTQVYLRFQMLVIPDQFPTISKLAKDVLPVPGTEVPSESAFSSARQTLTYTRSLLSPETLEALMITKYFLQKDIADMRLLAKYDDETVMALLEELGVLELDQLIALDNE